MSVNGSIKIIKKKRLMNFYNRLRYQACESDIIKAAAASASFFFQYPFSAVTLLPTKNVAGGINLSALAVPALTRLLSSSD